MIVLSHFSHDAPASLENHRQYAQAHGYRHAIVDASAMPQALPLRPLHRYESLLHVLRGAQPARAAAQRRCGNHRPSRSIA